MTARAKVKFRRMWQIFSLWSETEDSIVHFPGVEDSRRYAEITCRQGQSVCHDELHMSCLTF